jgi:hypothetical protein
MSSAWQFLSSATVPGTSAAIKASNSIFHRNGRRFETLRPMPWSGALIRDRCTTKLAQVDATAQDKQNIIGVRLWTEEEWLSYRDAQQGNSRLITNDVSDAAVVEARNASARARVVAAALAERAS